MILNTTIVSDDSSEDIDETVKCSHKEEPFLRCNLCDTLGKEMKAIKQDLSDLKRINIKTPVGEPQKDPFWS